MHVLEPPPLPEGSIYTGYFCEENAYKLVDEFISRHTITDDWDVFVVFISNADQMVALWGQKLAEADPPNDAMVWDYHVITILKRSGVAVTNAQTESGPEALNWVYDFDTKLSMPCETSEYICSTFPELHTVNEEFRPTFRVIPGKVFLDYFVSDRSHMLDNMGSCRAPLPPYPPICGHGAKERGETNNLKSNFVSMKQVEENLYGTVMAFDIFVSWAVG